MPKSKHTTGIKIRQASKFPPHYQILIDDTVYDVPSGRNNLFDVLALFVYQIKMNYNGYLGYYSFDIRLLFLGGKAIDLLSVISV